MLEKVIVVDEDIRTRDFLYEMISEIGLSVLTVPTGPQALDLLKKEKPAFIFIEDTPGEFSGIHLARKIRAIDKTVKIIMMGPNPDAGGLQTFLEDADILAYLPKNFHDTEVVKNILSILNSGSFNGPGVRKNKGRILIVDDEYENRNTTGQFLQRKGFEITSASSGEECLEKIKQDDFDIILLDVTMGGMDGLLTLKHIKDLATNAKVIMVTALQNKSILAEARAIGAKDYLVKPFNLETLENCILSVLKA